MARFWPRRFWVEVVHLPSESAERMEQTTFCKMGWGPPDFFQMDLLGRVTRVSIPTTRALPMFGSQLVYSR